MQLKEIVMLVLNLLMLGFASWGIYVASGSWFFGTAFIIGYVALSILMEYEGPDDGMLG